MQTTSVRRLCVVGLTLRDVIRANFHANNVMCVIIISARPVDVPVRMSAALTYISLKVSDVGLSLYKLTIKY